MEFRKATPADANSILNIIKQAQEALKSQGIDQWQNNYPNIDTVLSDIANENGYVLLKDGVVVGTVAVSFDGEKTYEAIYEGQWLSDIDFAVVHRIAVDDSYKGAGLASEIFKNIEKLCQSKGVFSIKVDTHKQNVSMQRVLQKNGFVYCGIIYTADKAERVAFEKMV